MNNQFNRTSLVIGTEGVDILKRSHVCVFGIGGVGGHCIEALARAGIGKLTIVDKDVVDITNINRQIIALHSTVGQKKTDVMKVRLLDINKDLEITSICDTYTIQNSNDYDMSKFDYVVDAIDMISSKIELIKRCNEFKVPIISCMGTGNKLNPTMLEISDINKTSVCPLARVVRRQLKELGIKKQKVLYSKETPRYSNNEDKSVIGSVSFVPSVAGLIIASEVVKDLLKV
jgi:tRNA A37 threonylcarbamoyladenosine dehydratase